MDLGALAQLFVAPETCRTLPRALQGPCMWVINFSGPGPPPALSDDAGAFGKASRVLRGVSLSASHRPPLPRLGKVKPGRPQVISLCSPTLGHLPTFSFAKLCIPRVFPESCLLTCLCCVLGRPLGQPWPVDDCA